ncbi:MAG: CDP-glucose 4,6-dehydratase [Blastochloris sp.]|nr:CDP-glucose 4,6-dehydratase [Blastochloris sp.]
MSKLASFYRGKRVLVSGHTGFKGGWLSLWLNHLGAQVYGWSLPAAASPNFHETMPNGLFSGEFLGDIRNEEIGRHALLQAEPEIVFHLAAQALVRRSYHEPLDTFSVNVLGTASLLERLRERGKPCTVVVVTSDKCYENVERTKGYNEDDPLGGHDPYSASKAGAELVVQSWRRSFFQPQNLGSLVSARGGNVIGGGDYAEDRIIPDSVRALLRGEAISLRNPSATRPWQHILDCLSGYLLLAQKVSEADVDLQLMGAFNFGPSESANRSVEDLVKAFFHIWPGEKKTCGDIQHPHEAHFLGLDTEKAHKLLGWSPRWDFDTAIKETALWYRARHVDRVSNMSQFSIDQIIKYETVQA